MAYPTKSDYVTISVVCHSSSIVLDPASVDSTITANEKFEIEINIDATWSFPAFACAPAVCCGKFIDY